MYNTCPICNEESKDGEFCSWCRSEARSYLKAFWRNVYPDTDLEDMYDLLEEEANVLGIEENRRKRTLKKGDPMSKVFKMVEDRRELNV